MGIEKYVLQPSKDKGWYVVTDVENGIECKFKKGEYNDTQEFKVLNLKSMQPTFLANHIAKAAKGITDWLLDNHADKILPIDNIRKEARERIGKSIKALRNKAGLSIRELSRLSGVGHSHLVRLESGKYGASIDTLSQIANVFNLHIGFIRV